MPLRKRAYKKSFDTTKWRIRTIMIVSSFNGENAENHACHSFGVSCEGWSTNIVATLRGSCGKCKGPVSNRGGIGSAKSIPNSQKQKQMTNTQWVKYVYSTALLTLEAGRAGRNHSTNTLWKPPFEKRLQLWQLKGQYSRSSCEGFFPKNCCPPHSSPHLPNIHHPHLFRPLHHIHLLHHLLYIYIYSIIIINNNNIIYVYLTYIIICITYTIYLSINPIYMTYVIYNTYMTYIIIYITTSSASPTSSKLSNLRSVKNIPVIFNIDNTTYISYRWSTSR